MYEAEFGIEHSDDPVTLINEDPKRYSFFEHKNATNLVMDNSHIIKECHRAAWLALSGNGFEKCEGTCRDFHAYMAAFRVSNIDGDPNRWNDLMDQMIRPMFSNLNKSPVPHLGQFKEYKLDHKIVVSVEANWNKTFDFKKGDILKVPLFDWKAYMAWRKFYWPLL